MRKGSRKRQKWGISDEIPMSILLGVAWMLAFMGVIYGDDLGFALIIASVVLICAIVSYALALMIVGGRCEDGPTKRDDRV